MVTYVRNSSWELVRVGPVDGDVATVEHDVGSTLRHRIYLGVEFLSQRDGTTV